MVPPGMGLVAELLSRLTWLSLLATLSYWIDPAQENRQVYACEIPVIVTEALRGSQVVMEAGRRQDYAPASAFWQAGKVAHTAAIIVTRVGNWCRVPLGDSPSV